MQSPFVVPYVNFSQRLAQTTAELTNAFSAVLASGKYIMGPEMTTFEKEFATACHTKHAISVSSGTCALYLVLRSMDLKPQDEVITVPNSFVATTASIALAGGKPVFVDIGDDLNIDVRQIEKAITPRTRAILPVHLAGRPCQMDAILEIANRRNLLVIEDSAQSYGATYKGRPVGGWGHAACFSFHPMKSLHAFGDGGMITTNDDRLHEYLLLARNHGLRNRDKCEFWSDNCRLDEMQAAFLRVQFRYVDQWNEERRRLAFRYTELLKGVVGLPVEKAGEKCIYATYTIQSERRDELSQLLAAKGVEAPIHYPTPLHLQPAAQDLGYSAQDFPRTMRASKMILSLPIYPGITADQQNYVADVICKFHQQPQRLAG